MCPDIHANPGPVRLNNFSGGYDHDRRFASDSILQYDQDTKNFKEVGKLEQRRRSHKMSVVDTNDFNCS